MPRRYWIVGSLLLAAAAGVALFSYPSLPAEVPSHWNAAGEIDDTMSRPAAVVFIPLVMLGVLLLGEVIVRFSPAGYRVDAFKGIVGFFTTALAGFLLVLFVAQMLAGLGRDVPMVRVVVGGLGLLFVALGNYFGKLRKNFFVGIRTPWTLASDEVWARTHRAAGWLYVLAGLAVLLASLAGIETIWLIVGLVTVGLVPVVYSFALYRRLEGFEPDDETLRPES